MPLGVASTPPHGRAPSAAGATATTPSSFSSAPPQTTIPDPPPRPAPRPAILGPIYFSAALKLESMGELQARRGWEGRGGGAGATRLGGKRGGGAGATRLGGERGGGSGTGMGGGSATLSPGFSSRPRPHRFIPSFALHSAPPSPSPLSLVVPACLPALPACLACLPSCLPACQPSLTVERVGERLGELRG